MRMSVIHLLKVLGGAAAAADRQSTEDMGCSAVALLVGAAVAEELLRTDRGARALEGEAEVPQRVVGDRHVGAQAELQSEVGGVELPQVEM